MITTIKRQLVRVHGSCLMDAITQWRGELRRLVLTDELLTLPKAEVYLVVESVMANGPL